MAMMIEEKDDIQEQIKKAMELEKIKTQKMYDTMRIMWWKS
mgnify:CR=1 FL=1